MKNLTKWANIICDRDIQPYKMIVTDGEWRTEIPVTNSSVKSCKHAAMSVYGVKPANILVTQVLGEK